MPASLYFSFLVYAVQHAYILNMCFFFAACGILIHSENNFAMTVLCVAMHACILTVWRRLAIIQ